MNELIEFRFQILLYMDETKVLDAVDKDFNELIHSLEIVGLIISILLPTMLEMKQLTLKGNNPIGLIAVLVFSLLLAFTFLFIALSSNKKYMWLAIFSIISSATVLNIILLVTLLYISALVGSISISYSYAPLVYWSFPTISLSFTSYVLIKIKSIFRQYRNFVVTLISALLISLSFIIIYVVSSSALTLIVPANILDKYVAFIILVLFAFFVVFFFLFLMPKNKRDAEV